MIAAEEMIIQRPNALGHGSVEAAHLLNQCSVHQGASSWQHMSHSDSLPVPIPHYLTIVRYFVPMQERLSLDREDSRCRGMLATRTRCGRRFLAKKARRGDMDEVM